MVVRTFNAGPAPVVRIPWSQDTCDPKTSITGKFGTWSPRSILLDNLRRNENFSNAVESASRFGPIDLNFRLLAILQRQGRTPFSGTRTFLSTQAVPQG